MKVVGNIAISTFKYGITKIVYGEFNNCGHYQGGKVYGCGPDT